MNKTMQALTISIAISSIAFLGTAQADTTKAEASLYQRLGGYDAIVAVVDDLASRLFTDKELGRFWEHRGEDGIDREKQLIVDFIASKAGGKLYYTGRDMEISHVGMRISESDWDLLMKHLDATIGKFKLAPKERQDVIAFIESTKEDIVELP